MWLIGGDDNFVGQFLVILGVKETQKKKEEGRYSVKWIANEQGYEEKYRGRGGDLTSGTTKPTAILLRRKRLRAPELVKRSTCRRFWEF